MMLRRACSHVQTLAPWRHLHRLPPRPLAVAAPHLFSSPAVAGGGSLTKKVEDLMPIATGLERDELEAELQGRKRFDMDVPSGPYGTKEASAVVQSYYNKRIVDCPGGEGGHFASLRRVPDIYPKRLPGPFPHCLQSSGYFTSRSLSAEDVSNMEPISSPLTPLLGMGTKAKDAGSKPPTVQAIKKGIKQSPKKVNLVAKLVRGMRVQDALLQLQVTVKRAAKTVYQVIHSARANAAHNHGLDPDRLLVAEAFVGKGLYMKRLSYHAKGKCGVMERPRCRLTVVVRETTPEEEAKIAKLRVSNYKKLTKTERQLVPHQLIETTPRWGRKRKEDVAS